MVCLQRRFLRLTQKVVPTHDIELLLDEHTPESENTA